MLIMRSGQITGDLPREEFSQETILEYAAGLKVSDDKIKESGE
jgi:ABC-type sugar transport system ATPase subunit